MKTTTMHWRWLFACLLVFGLAGTAHAQRTVTLSLNMATAPDTVTANDAIEVRGCITSCEDNQATLPDDNVIAWDDRTTLHPTNVGGDYWEISFQIPDEEQLDFKFFSPLLEADGLGGWEDGGNHVIPSGTGDTTLTLHYYVKGEGQDYDWRPWEMAQDSITVYYRVWIATESAQNKGFVGGSDDLQVGLRGDPLEEASPLDWGSTDVILDQEGENVDNPAYWLYSAPVKYPISAAGQTQPYKFYIEGEGIDGWEGSIGDRTFVVPDQDTTLHWVYYDESPPTDIPFEDTRVTTDVIFAVDIEPLQTIGIFDKGRGDQMVVLGEFNAWENCLDADPQDPDACQLVEDLEGDYVNILSVTANPADTMNYKFFGDFQFDEAPEGWEEPLDFGGGNRQFRFEGEQGETQNLGMQFFNGVRQANVVPAGTEVEVIFQVEMGAAMEYEEPFDPATDTVFAQFEDPVWIWSQENNKGIEELGKVKLTPESEGSSTYTGTYTLVGPTYNGLGYRYQYGNDADGYVQEGSGGFDPGRRRYQYVLPNQDGSFPSSYTLPIVTFQEEGSGPSPFACNPTAPEDVGLVEVQCYEAGQTPPSDPLVTAVTPIGEVPSQITLSGNYPNPFNPSTSFTYTLPTAQQVSVRVFDVTGRVVATLVDGQMQPADTYRVHFNAQGLASGVYVYQLQTPSRVLTQKMVLVK